MTKEEAYSVLNEEFTQYNGKGFIFNLCNNIPIELREDWRKYWDKINTEEHCIISSYIKADEDFDVQLSLTRLLTIHMFIEDTYK